MSTICKLDPRVRQARTRRRNAVQDLKSRGWDGQSYMVTGKRGATYLAYRNAKTGEFSIV